MVYDIVYIKSKYDIIEIVNNVSDTRQETVLICSRLQGGKLQKDQHSFTIVLVKCTGYALRNEI